MHRRDALRFLAAGSLAWGATARSADSRPVWPSLETLVAQLEQWRRQHPGRMQLETVGRSVQGRPIYAAMLTDASVDAANKEHTLVTSLHSGIERTGATTAFHLLKWLLSDDAAAREVLRRQVVTVMPLVNPDGYVLGAAANARGRDPYTAWTPAGPADPAATPEAVAVQRVMDRAQPELHADIHGLDLSFAGYLMSESSGAAWSNAALRPYHHEIVDRMNEAALAEGFASVRPEEDAERLPWGPDMASSSDKLWYGRARPYAALYAYLRYHALIVATEVCWERSGVARHRRLLRFGNERWPGEQHSGYPVRVVAGTELHRIVAYGHTAAERRRSRVELWNKLPQLQIGFANPQAEGLLVCAATTSPSAARRFAGLSLKEFLQHVEADPAMHAEGVRRTLANHPDGPGQWGPRAEMYWEGPAAAPTSSASAAGTLLAHGLALRLRIPFAKARLLDLCLNGRPLAVSPTDGYELWRGEGFTHVQVNIPPDRSARADFFLVTGRYDPEERRARGWP